MSYVNRPVNEPGREVINEPPVVVNRFSEYHDRVRWGPIIAGLMVAIATQLVLSAFGGAIGASVLAGSGAPRSNAPGVITAVSIADIIYLFIALFIGSWVTARACGPVNRNTALLNGAILWATTLALSSWLLASGVPGTFGVILSNRGTYDNAPSQLGLTAGQARAIAGNTARGLWSFGIGSLIGLAAALAGASTGARSPRNYA